MTASDHLKPIPLTDAELTADGQWCPDCGDHPREACECIARLENMTEAELDAELRSYGIDPKELHSKMLERLLKAKAEGHDTPMLNEAIKQFSEGQ